MSSLVISTGITIGLIHQGTVVEQLWVVDVSEDLAVLPLVVVHLVLIVSLHGGFILRSEVIGDVLAGHHWLMHSLSLRGRVLVLKRLRFVSVLMGLPGFSLHHHLVSSNGHSTSLQPIIKVGLLLQPVVVGLALQHHLVLVTLMIVSDGFVLNTLQVLVEL